jgi:C-terminal processing protease CtpA/Prc
MTHEKPSAAVRLLMTAAAVCWLALACAPARAQQQLGPYDRDSARAMLAMIRDDLKNNYYDPALRGMKLEEKFKEADERIKAAQTRDQLMVPIAQFLLNLDDSHTVFLPPGRAARIEYGWRVQMVGDRCFVTALKPKSDAESKLRPGDEVISIDGFRPTRSTLWKMSYRYYALAPARAVRFVVQSPGESQPREVTVESKIELGQAVRQWEDIYMQYLREEWDIYQDRFYEAGDDLLIWKMPTFVVEDQHVDDVMARARKRKTLVLDLRGNGGGLEDALVRLTGYFFDRDVKVAERKGRKESKVVTAKTRGDRAFKGNLVVLVDGGSGSASEMFARVVQLEKRGTVLGDRTAGAVMTSRYYGRETGVGRVLYFGSSITVGDVIMNDGQSLEHVGVMPDEVLLPTGADLAARRDPVLARAAALAGVQLDPAKAGTLFPVDWKK